ncbi:MAG: HAD family hydrolase [Phycisphaerales bacterium]|nr:HAD family hydrolase [Phycisphaerales bacterium]
MSETLILFDIDGTLLRTNGAGIGGFVEAGVRVFGKDFSLDGLLVGGQLDPLILDRALGQLGMAPDEVNLRAFRHHYHECLGRLFKSGERESIAMPGVQKLLDQLEALAHVDIGLLTGNLAETGQLKLGAAGIKIEQFCVHAWGDDGETRDHLPPVALERWLEHRGIERDFEHTVIIGDTIYDVQCAKANGCRVLAVCTGVDDRETLEAAGADWVVDDLSDTEAVLEWLLQS